MSPEAVLLVVTDSIDSAEHHWYCRDQHWALDSPSDPEFKTKILTQISVQYYRSTARDLAMCDVSCLFSLVPAVAQRLHDRAGCTDG